MTPQDMEFEWNETKAASNLKKPGVSFDEAETVFDDEHAFTQDDELHSDDEPREIIIGYSDHNRLVIVAFVQRLPNRIRIISARAATLKERNIYEEASRF